MKKNALTALGLALALFAIAPSTHARALVGAGSQEIAASGMLDFASEVGTQTSLDARYSYFVVDQFSIGAGGGFSDNDYATQIRLGFVAEWNFLLSDDYRPLIGTDFVPFIGGGVGLQYTDSDDDDVMAGVLSGEVGTKFFLADDFALTASCLGQLASDDIFMNDRKASSADISLRLGMRFYF